MNLSVTALMTFLASTSRVVLLGGLAVIAHGLQRATKDAAAWLDPLQDEKSWSDRVIRIMGADRPLDLFRQPHQLELGDFDAVWEAAKPLENTGIRLPDEVDLLLTKEDTGREHDLADILFLQHKAEQRFAKVIRSCGYSDAVAIFDRFLTRQVAEAALENSDEQISQLALAHLQELAAAGDPYAQDLVAKRQ